MASPCRHWSTSRPGRSSPTTSTRSPSTSARSGSSTTATAPPTCSPSVTATRSWRWPRATTATSTTRSTKPASPPTPTPTSEAYHRLFDRLDWLEEQLADRRYLVGDTITEADVRLWPTLVRFDAVYHNHFKCNRNKLTEMPALWGYARDLFQTPGFGDTIDFPQIKAALLRRAPPGEPDRHRARRPRPVGWATAHDRDQLGGSPFGDGVAPPAARPEELPDAGANPYWRPPAD